MTSGSMRQVEKKRGRRPRLDGDIQRFCFSGIFNNLSARQVSALRQMYRDNSGILPARRTLAECARAIGISQARTKRWFNEQKLQNDSCPHSPLLPTSSSSSSWQSDHHLESDPFLCTLSNHMMVADCTRLFELEERLDKMQNQLGQLGKGLQGIQRSVHQIALVLIDL